MNIVSRDKHPWFMSAAKERLQVLPPHKFYSTLDELERSRNLPISEVEIRRRGRCSRLICNCEKERDVFKWC